MNTYKRARRFGHTASEAKRIHDVSDHFEWLEYGGKVRLRAEPEQEGYFDVFGDSEPYVGANGRRVSAEQAQQEMVDILDRDGCWRIVTEYRCDSCGQWQHADSVGMNAGYRDVLDPVENCYVVDLMQSAIDEVTR